MVRTPIYSDWRREAENLFTNASLEASSGIAEVRRNLIPSSDTSSVGQWAGTGGEGTLSTEGKRLKLTSTGVNSVRLGAVINLSEEKPAGTYVASYRAEALSPNLIGVRVYLYNSTTGVIYQQSLPVLPGETKYEFTITAAAAFNRVYMEFYGTAIASGDVGYLSEPLLEAAPIHRPFFSGVAFPALRRNLARNPNGVSAIGFSNNSATANVTTKNEPLPAGNPQGITVGVKSVLAAGQSSWRLLSVYNLDGLLNTGPSRKVGAWFWVNAEGFQARIGTSSSPVPMPARTWVWATGDAAANSYISGYVERGDGTNASASDVAYITGVTALLNETPLEAIWGGAPENAGLAYAWDGAPDSSSSFVYETDFSIAWVGTPNASEAILTGVRVTGVTAAGCVAIRSTRWKKHGDYSMRLVATSATSAATYVYIGIPSNAWASGVLMATRYQEAPLTGTIYSGGPVIRAQVPTQASAPFNEAGEREMRVDYSGLTSSYLLLLFHGGMVGSGDVWYDCIGMFAGTYDGPWFDGSSPDLELARHAWTGDPNASTSTREVRTITGYYTPSVLERTPGIKLRIENNGVVVDISNKLPVGFLKLRGASGFGIAPTTLTIREGAADGGRFRRSRRGPRNIDLPLAFQGESQSEVLAYMQTLVRALNDRYSTPRLYVTYPTGEELYTDVHYAGGGDHVYGEDTNGMTYAKWPLSLRSPSPYWTSTESINFSLTNTNAGRGLIKNAPLSNLELSSSSAIGSIVLENPGDVEAYPEWKLTGPATFFEASIDGVGFRYDEPLLNANPITINAEAKTVVDSTGANRYADLAAAPKLFAIPPGSSNLEILMDGVDSTSSVLFNIQPRYEVVF